MARAIYMVYFAKEKGLDLSPVLDMPREEIYPLLEDIVRQGDIVDLSQIEEARGYGVGIEGRYFKV